MRNTDFKLNCERLKDIRVAAVMDKFTEHCYAPECVLLQLTPKNWLKELISFKPDILFIESAWRGKDDLWRRIGHNPSDALLGVIRYCNSNNIPTIFWSKEDPVNYSHFCSIPSFFDFIFTTDKDSVPVYKRDFDKDEVYFMHFAAQPSIHNPIEKFNRKNKFCFAGSYYMKYPVRQRDFKVLMDVALDKNGVEIYDRNYKTDDPAFMFPDEYVPYIRGTLSPDDIDVAYKGYFYNININTIKDSSTMFARRVFELLASNTVVVSNYSKGLRTIFGNYLINSDDFSVINEKLSVLTSDELNYKKYKLAGLRNILKQHLYEDRLAYIVDKVFHKDLYYKFPVINVFYDIESEEKCFKVYESFKRQDYDNKRLFIFSEIKEFDFMEDKNVKVLSKVQKNNFLNSIGTEGYLACFSADDYYGKNYLLDLALALRYSDVEIVSKSEYYVHDKSDDFSICNIGDSYKYVSSVDVNRSIFKAKYYKYYIENDDILSNVKAFSIDSFNYCKNYSGSHLTLVDDLDVDYNFANLLDICNDAESLEASKEKEYSGDLIIGSEFLLSSQCDYIVFLREKNNFVKVVVSEPDGKAEEFYSDMIPFDSSKEYRFFLSGYIGAQHRFGCVYYDGFGNKISRQRFEINVPPIELIVPDNAVGFKIYSWFKGEGTGLIYRFRLTAHPKSISIS